MTAATPTGNIDSRLMERFGMFSKTPPVASPQDEGIVSNDTTGGGGGDDMEKRLTEVEKAIVGISSTLDYMKQNMVTKSDISDFRVEIAGVRTELRTSAADARSEVASVRAAVFESKSDIIKWAVLTALGIATTSVTIMTFVLNNATPKASAAQPAQPQPIIIQVPAYQPPPPTK